MIGQMMTSDFDWVLIEAVARAIEEALGERLIGSRLMARAAINAAAPFILDMAAKEVIGYVHPAFEKLPGDAFASAKIAALKERFGREIDFKVIPKEDAEQ